MTKQEQIEEMISAMAASNNPFVDVPIEIMPKVAKALYNADYRKADEVRKETAKEILTTLNKAIFWGQQYDDECTFGRDVWNGLLEEYGVKVKNDKS